MASDPRSVLDREAPGPELIVRYGELPDQLFDVHLPAGPPIARPVVVLLHGGFWRQEFDRVHMRPLADAIRREGYVVVSPEYRRTGGAGEWPYTFDDIRAVRAALPPLLAETAPRRAAAGPVSLVGHSAGGHLAMWWALDASAEEVPSRVVALAPVADLARAYADDLDGGAVRDLVGGGPDQFPERYTAADVAPLLQTRDAASSFHVIHGDRDQRIPIEHSRALHRVTLHELPGMEHFGLIDPLSAAWPVLLEALRA